MNILAHITMFEIGFVMSVFLLGFVSGGVLAWALLGGRAHRKIENPSNVDA